MKRALAWADLELLETLGEGHSGTVRKARLRRTVPDFPAGSVVAVKTYKRWVVEEPGFMERFLREVSVARSVAHSNVLQVHGAVTDDEGKPALVMEFFPGVALEHELARRRMSDEPYTFDEAVRILRQIASGLSALHKVGAVHRDVKPANILVHDDRVVLADFGVVQSASFPEQTSTGVFLGRSVTPRPNICSVMVGMNRSMFMV